MPKSTPNTLDALKENLLAIEHQLLQHESQCLQHFPLIQPAHKLSSRNLLHYLSLRSIDIRKLQDILHNYGLSSLANAESHILRQLQAVAERLGHSYTKRQVTRCTWQVAKKNLDTQATLLFGERQDIRVPYIMVTFDAAFADNYALVKTLLQSGMNVARINCAHDDEATWFRLIQILKRARSHTGLPCKIYMDLAGPKIRTRIIGVDANKGKVKVEEGDLIWFTESAEEFNKKDILISPNEPDIIRQLNPGQRVFIDDGVITGVVEKKLEHAVAVRLTRVAKEKNHIKNDKGINLPDSDLSIDALTDDDQACLPFIYNHADLVGYSFVHNPNDVARLQQMLEKIGPKPPFIVIKVETPQAVSNLPALLLQGMQKEAFGVMIARGDLAVEIGFERMSEIQNEILWICEAAHVPVIWATQVLETLNKLGVASRSEITDAAHGAMAECVMINKGDHTVEVIETLKDVLRRIGGHQIKKRHIFRPLGIAKDFLKQHTADKQIS
jgi:pyruvate kinase